MDSMDLDKTISNRCSEDYRHFSIQGGSAFGQYKIIRPLGRGGMGEVYEVEQSGVDKHFALKMLSDDFTRQENAVERFRKEAMVMARLEHENIVPIIDATSIDGKYCLKMELANGVIVNGERICSLQEYANYKGGRIDQELLAGILVHVLNGLQYAHSKGVIHRDLKPANILFTTDANGESTFKIADFGLVGLVGEDWLRTQAKESRNLSLSMGDKNTLPEPADSKSSFVGTYDYMSPEQKRGEPLDESSDIYSLGVIAFRLLTGRSNTEFELPSQIVEGLHPKWDNIIRSCMQISKKKRYKNCAALSKPVEEIEQSIVWDLPRPDKKSKSRNESEDAEIDEKDVNKQNFLELKKQLIEERKLRQSEHNQRIIAEKKLKKEVKRRKAAERRWRKEVKLSEKAENQSAPTRKAPIQANSNYNEFNDRKTCPHGHGPLKLWEGKPRCWTCGWPEKKKA